MDGLSKHFEETYPDLLELGRWQVDYLRGITILEEHLELYQKEIR
jgi:hypothetical protein